jgi:membrane protein YdbS with pleckstrin-like domain
MDNIKNKSMENNPIRRKLKELIIIAIFLWIIFDIIGLLYLSLHIEFLLYAFYMIMAVIVLIFIYVIKNKDKISNK